METNEETNVINQENNLEVGTIDKPEEPKEKTPPPPPPPKKEIKIEVSEVLTLQLLQADVASLNHRRYSKFAVKDAMDSFRHDQALPLARKNDQYNSKDIYYIRKNGIHYEEGTGILTVDVPHDVVNMAPGYYAVPVVKVIKSHYVLDAKKEKLLVIDQFRFHEVSLIKEDNAYPNLNSRLMIPKK